MRIGKPQEPKDPRSAENQVGIPELLRLCLVEEQQNLTKQDLDKLKLMLAKGYFFAQPLFEPPPTVNESSAINKEVDLKIRTRLWEADKHRHILDLLRTVTDQKSRLVLLAQWLNQEKICEPEDIVGIEELQRLATKTFRCISYTDFHHADRVRSWLPYFERLLTDYRASKGAASELAKLGYDKTAVRAASRKKSAIPAACEWLAARRDSVHNVDALTLQNAYSRVYGPKRRPANKPHTLHGT
jgi:hypothetical protein